MAFLTDYDAMLCTVCCRSFAGVQSGEYGKPVDHVEATGKINSLSCSMAYLARRANWNPLLPALSFDSLFNKHTPGWLDMVFSAGRFRDDLCTAHIFHSHYLM